MLSLVLVVLAGLLLVGVALDLLRNRAGREDWDLERHWSHERLMREVRHHAPDER
jgi:hypothetical protein